MALLRNRSHSRPLSPLFEEDNMDRWDKRSKYNIRLTYVKFVQVLVVLLLIYFYAELAHKPVPKPLLLQDEKSRPGEFIAERALNHVKNLTQFGPRPVGSFANEVLAVNYLLKEINAIVKRASQIHRINVDLQKVDGVFPLQFLDGMTNIYKNVQNVLVKIGSPVDSPHSILVNCHFDSVADSPGGSDDGASCAVMLEMFRQLAESKISFTNNVIFLFNGAEENLMEGSHGFITQHKWAKEVIAVINMDACGAGGKELLFQAGPENPWLIEAYASSAKVAMVTSIAQEVFESGIIPGDTDYRIFRDFGNVPGLDFAWARNGYIYHTKLDDADHVPLETLQNTGENILSLIINLAKIECPQQCPKKGNMIFFDVLGFFVVIISEVTSTILNVTLIVASLGLIYYNASTHSPGGLSKTKYFSSIVLCTLITLFSWICTLICSISIGFILMFLNRTMSWYSRPMWIYFTYAIPSFAVPIHFTALLTNWQIRSLGISSRWYLFRIHVDGYQLLLTISVLISVLLRIRSGFLPALLLFFYLLANAVKDIIVHRFKGSWLYFYVGIMIFPFLINSIVTQFSFGLFIPILGRSGAGNYAEITLAVASTTILLLLFSFIIPVISLVPDYHVIIKYSRFILFYSLLVLLMTPLGFPYSANVGNPSPQRYVILHVTSTEHNFDGVTTYEKSGYWVVDLDINSPHFVKSFVPEIANAIPIEDCHKRLYCGLPYLIPISTLIWRSHWIPAPKPNIFVPSTLTLVNRESRPHNIIRLNLTVAGPDHMSLIMSPFEGVELVSWSLAAEKPLKGPKWGSRETYFLYYSCASNSEPLNFYIDLLVSELKINTTHPGTIDFSLSGHFLHGAHQRTIRLKKLLSQFPPWTVTSGWTASHSTYVF